MPIVFLLLLAAVAETDTAQWIVSQGGTVTRDGAGQIVAIDLSSSWINDSDLDKISHLPKLRKLDISHTKITDVGLEHLKSLREVTDLNLYYAEYVTESGIAHLRDWSKLERLNLRGTKVASRVFEYLAHLTSLKSLDVAFTRVDDEGFEQLASLEKLEHLACGGNRLSGAFLPSLKLFPALTHLDVGGIQREDSGLWGLPLTGSNLERLGELTRLKILNLSGANLADRGLDRPGHPEAERSELKELSRLKGLVNLEVLDLSHTPISSAGLADIQRLPKLRELRLGLAKNVDDTAISVLAGMPRLEVLFLSATAITERGFTELRQMRQLKRVCCWE